MNKKGVQSSNGVAKRTVLRRATTHIAFANDFLGMLKPWPVHSPQIKMLVKAHFKKASKGLIQRVPFKYSPADVLRLAKSATDHTSPFVRHILRIELVKVLGCLRTDDSIYMDPVDFKVNLREGVIEGRTEKTKSTEQTSGNIVGGMCFRLPLLPALGPNWYKGFFGDAVSCGFRPGGGFIIPKDERAAKLNLPVHIAESRDAVRHLRTALRLAGFSPKTYNAISEHTAKRTGSAAIRRYNGPSALSTEEYGHWLHHRPSGPFQSVSAYNPDNLVVPAQKVHIILQEWLQTASPLVEVMAPKWTWGRLQYAHGPSVLRFHVLVPIAGRREVFKHLLLRNQTEPLQLNTEDIVWVPLCDFLRAKRFQNSDGSATNCLFISAPVQCSIRCQVCVSRANRTLWKG